MAKPAITLEAFCEGLIKDRQGDVQDGLSDYFQRDYFQLIGRNDRDACTIKGTHAFDEVEAELKRAVKKYRDN